jgi:hypothetical protein
MHVTWSLASPSTLAVMLLAATLVASGAYAQEKKLAETPRQLSLETKPWKGDFDAMFERRMIRGAIGVIQIMPATGNQMRVGDIRSIEPNIHAGAKYMDQLMTRYFPEAPFNETNRTLFAFAAYNAGPGNLSKIRKEAEKRGLDPNWWFNNVEIVTAERIGIETTTYVRNIYKYYAAYKLTQEAQATQRKAREQVAPSAPSH